MDASATTGLRCVVLASDFSPGARRALRRTQYLPFASPSEIVVAHVLPPGDHSQDLTKTAEAHLRRESEVLRNALQRKHRSNVEVRAASPSGSPAVEIVKLARERSADLVVCGRQGAGKMRRLLLGTTAERIAHLASVPVLVVGSRPAGPFTAPLAALTADEHARFVLDAALHLVVPGTRVDVVSAVSVAMEGWLWGGWISSKEILRIRKLTRDKAERDLEAILAPYRERGAHFRVALREGDARKVIMASADRWTADLIAVGSHAHPTGVVHFHLGSVSASIVREAPCDVLVARAPGVTVEAAI